MSALEVGARATLAAGDVVGGKYTIACVVGEGGMGVVYEARHERLGQKVALKVLRSDEAHHEEIVARFEREARAAARLKSPNVARVYDVDQLPDGTPYMVLEYLDGVDLDAELTSRGRLPTDEAVGYVLQACSAVAEAHSVGIIHRDLKPHNLFLVGDGSCRQVKLLDFGISKVLEDGEQSVTLTRSSLGTPLYMSPEQIRSSRNIDVRSDIWSLGVILYELVTGSTPFEGEGPTAVIAAITADTLVPPHERCPSVPKALSEAIVKALEKDPANRYQTVGEFADAISQYGPAGLWIEPIGGSSPSNPRISIHDAITVRADAVTLLADSSSSNQPIALTPAPKPAPARRGIWLALAAVAVVAGSIGFVLSRPRSPAAGAEAPRAESAAQREALPPTTSEATAAPAASVEVAPAMSAAVADAAVAAKPPAGAGKPTPHGTGPLPHRPGIAVKLPAQKSPPAASAEPKPPAQPTAPPAAVDNPLHL